MSKVKKRAVLTGVRNAGARKAAPARKVAKKGKPVAKAARKAATKAGRKPAKKTRKAVTPAAKKSPKRAPKQVARGSRKTAKKVVKRGAARAPSRVTVVVAKGGARPGRLEPIVRFAIKPLDPLRKCGPSTSVQYLYRVDESVEGKTTAHLVFFDRHGWYCEHGRTCPAVAPARKFNGHIARVS